MEEERDDGLRRIIRDIGLVETVEYFHLRGCGDIDVAQTLVGKHSLDDGLVALEELTDERLRVFIASILSLHLQAAIANESLQIERSIERAVADALYSHRLVAHLVVSKQRSVPGKHRVGLRLQVFHHVTIAVNIVLAASADLLLIGKQVVEYGRVGGELSIYGERLDEHADGVAQALVVSPVVDCGEERLLLIVEFGKQKSISRREQRALENAIFLTERINGIGARVERA